VILPGPFDCLLPRACGTCGPSIHFSSFSGSTAGHGVKVARGGDR